MVMTSPIVTENIKSKSRIFQKICRWRQNPLLKSSQDYDEKPLKNGEKSQKSSQKCRKTILYPQITSRSNMEPIQIKWASKKWKCCAPPIFGRFGRRLFICEIGRFYAFFFNTKNVVFLHKKLKNYLEFIGDIRYVIKKLRHETFGQHDSVD